jgi:hypothetical protein
MMLVSAFVAGITMVLRGGLDSETAAYEITVFLLDYGLWFELVSSVLCITLFALMWRKIRVKLPKYKTVKTGVFTVVLTILLCAALNFVLVSIFEITNLLHYFPSYEAVAEVLSSGSIVVRVLMIGIAAPIAEELLCRGIVLNRLLSWMPKWVAIVTGSALFGLIHFNLLQTLYAFVVGVLFSVLYLRYRNLWIPIIGHMAFNLANVILGEIMEVTGAEINAWMLLIPGALISAACVALFIKYAPAAVPVSDTTTDMEAASSA